MSQQEVVFGQEIQDGDLASAFFQSPEAKVADDRLTIILKILGIRPLTNSWPMAIPAQLVRRHKEIMQLTEREQLPISFVGYDALFPGTRVYNGPNNDWVMMNLNDDPLYLTNRKKLLAPPAVHEELGRIAATGIDFDSYFIAHEIPPGSMQSGQEIPLELFEPIEHPKPVRRVNTFANYTARLWNGITHGYAKMAEAGAAALTLPLAALLALDPVLFGVHVDDSWKSGSDPIGMFYFLASWNWSEKEK